MHYAYAAYARANSNKENYRVWKINWNVQSKLCASFDDSTVHSGHSENDKNEDESLKAENIKT